MKKYDYIVCGGGCAGLSLLIQIIDNQFFKSKRIAFIETNHRAHLHKTWCFWQEKPVFYSSIINYQWDNLIFKNDQFEKKLAIDPYSYFQIQSKAFYEFAYSKIQKSQNIDLIEDTILSIDNQSNKAIVNTTKESYEADFAFNSTLLLTNKNEMNTSNSLLQHFKGIEILIEEPVFNPTEATFMDFSVPQNLGAAFVYVLPTANNKALIEYTFFTKKLLHQHEYDTLLNNYIKEKLKIQKYTILQSEYGIIPMTDFIFPAYKNRIINIGTAGGAVKASSGFAFNNIQKQVTKIVLLLSQNKLPQIKRTFTDKKFHFYDAVLLEVIATNKYPADKVFAMIFKKSKPQLVLKFLNNETNIFEDLKIMSSVPTKIFLPVAIKKLIAAWR
jgi:lycopene beta-cyclase